MDSYFKDDGGRSRPTERDVTAVVLKYKPATNKEKEVSLLEKDALKTNDKSEASQGSTLRIKEKPSGQYIAFVGRNAELAELVEQFQRDIKSLEVELGIEKVKVKLLRGDIQEREKKVDWVKKEMNEINRQKVYLEEKVKGLEEAVFKLKKAVDEIYKKNVGLESELRNAQDKNAVLAGKLEGMRHTEKEKQAEMDRLVKSTVELSTMVKNFEGKVGNCESLISCGLAREKELRLLLEEKQRELEQILWMNGELGKEKIKLIEQVGMVRSQGDAELCKALEKHGKEMEEAVKRNHQLAGSAETLEKKLDDQQKYINSLEEKSEDTKAELRRAEERVKETVKEKVNTERHFQQKVDHLENENNSLNEQLKQNVLLNKELNVRCSQLGAILEEQETRYREFQCEFDGDLKQISAELKEVNQNYSLKLNMMEGACESQYEWLLLMLIYLLLGIFFAWSVDFPSFPPPTVHDNFFSWYYGI